MYRDYDQASLDLQYDVGAHYAGMEEFRATHAAARDAANRAARAQDFARLDQPYGTHAREKIDLFLADRPNAPLLIYIHGGYWKARDRSDFSFLGPAFADRGVSLAAVGYPLCPEVRLRSIVESCRQAVAFLAGNAARYGIDPARIHISGHSAGGHLSAMMMATDWTRFGQPDDLLKTGIAISGVYDLEPVAMTKVNTDINIDAGEIADLSPIRLSPRHTGKLIVTAGSKETAEFIRQTSDFAHEWGRGGKRTVAIASPGFYHFDVVDTLGRPGSALHEMVLAEILAPRS
jgi:arylformamidase